MNYNRLFIDIIKNGINKTEVNYDDLDYKTILDMASDQGMFALVYSFIKKYIPKEEKKAYDKIYFATITKATIFEEEFNKICTELEKEKITVCTYKGTIIKYLYPNPEYRLMGDMDFCFNISDETKIRNIMYRLGYKNDGEIGSHHKYLKEPFVEIEFHDKMHEMHTDINVFEDIFSYVIPFKDYKYINEVEYTYHFAYLLTHIYQHLVGAGAGIRNYLDLYLFYTKYKKNIDFKKVKELLEEENLGDFYEFNMKFMLDIFTDSANLGDSEIDKYLYYIFKGGIYGFGNFEEAHIRRRSKYDSKFKYVMSQLFPSPKIMINSRPYLKKHKILIIFLPALYIYRIIRFLVHPKRVKNQSKAVFANENELNESMEFLKMVGIDKK